jgi:ferredoxin
MTYVIAEPCIGVKDRSCLDVCPVDCIYEGIDCGACVPECPVTAIFTEEEVPPNWESYIAKNRDVFKSDQPPAAPKR